MKILIAASECSPLVKVGGIADVIGSLPIALKTLGIDVRVVIPFYKDLSKIESTKVKETSIKFDNTENPIEIYQTKLPDSEVIVYMIKNEKYISNGGVYYSPENMPSPKDELLRFAFFSKAVSDVFSYPDAIFAPDVIHCNDWHTGMIPQIIQSTHGYNLTKAPKTVFTIHNLAYQGFSKLDVAEKLGLNIKTDQTLRWDANDDNLDFILQGIVGSNYITTVSEKYAEEIQTPEFGEGLEDILKSREGRLKGILNGISYEIFNPLDDEMIYKNFSINDVLAGKAANKRALQAEINLEQNPDRPLIGIVSRLASQKGLDLVADSLDDIIKMGYQMVLLGTGDPQLEAKLNECNDKDLCKMHYRAMITFSEDLARKIYAASDILLIPSRYEPSGLTQMIAMKYGSVPVVRATGGLYDTVQNEKTGFTFEQFSREEMMSSLEKAFQIYSNNQQKWASIIKNCLQQDFSWEQSAKKYALIYSRVRPDVGLNPPTAGSTL